MACQAGRPLGLQLLTRGCPYPCRGAPFTARDPPPSPFGPSSPSLSPFLLPYTPYSAEVSRSLRLLLLATLRTKLEAESAIFRLKAQDPVVAGKSRRNGMASSHVKVFLFQKLSTEGGIILLNLQLYSGRGRTGGPSDRAQHREAARVGLVP